MNQPTNLETKDDGRVASNAGLDVVARIRATHAWNHGPYLPCSDKALVRSTLPFEAADTIELLQNEIAWLRTQLELFINV